MSELAFDKDGEPIEVHPDTEWYAVRAFQNPGARGTCSIARDDEGAPIHIERDGGFLDLKRAVRGVPALYRLDQCDASRARIVGAPAAYVLINESSRNGTGLGGNHGTTDQEPLVLVLMELIRAQSDALRVTAKEQSNMMRAASELLRAADQAGISRRPAPPPSPVEDIDDDEEELEDDSDDDQPPPKHVAEVLAEKLIPKVDMVLSHWISKKMKSEPPPPAAAPSPAPAPAPTPAPAAAPSAGAAPPAAAAAGPGPVTPPPNASPAATGATVTETVEATTVTVTPSSSSAPDGAARNAAPTITPEQIQHLLTIQARLSPREQSIANLVRERMSPDQQAQWLAELSAMTVDQALQLVRSMIPEPTSKRPPGVPTSAAAPTSPNEPSTGTALATSPADAPGEDE
jgi:hypothetical protein